jgi:hypothetical protein
MISLIWDHGITFSREALRSFASRFDFRYGDRLSEILRRKNEKFDKDVFAVLLGDSTQSRRWPSIMAAEPSC